MKKFATLLLLAFAVSSCVKEVEPEQAEQSTLIVSKDTIALTNGHVTDSSIVQLSCGCNFELTIEHLSGDTNVIDISQTNVSNGAHRIALAFTADTLAAAGTYAADVAFLSHSVTKGTFRDTIHVTYTR
jgi:hypothetical protein